MSEEENVSATAADEPQVIPNEEPLPPPEEHEAKKAKEPEGQEEEPNDGEPAEGDGEEEPAQEDEGKPRPRKRRGRQEREIGRLKGEIDELKSIILRQHGQQPQQQTRDAPKPPKQEAFTDYGEFLEARAEWKAQQTVQQILQQERQQIQNSQRQRSQEAAKAQYGERLETARDKYEDFDDVAFDDSLPITDAMANAIMTADNGPEIQYYLGNNPAEAKKIAGMDPISQVRAIGRLEAKLLTPSPKKTTSAPKPVKPLGGTAGGGVGSNDPAKMTMAQYKEWREKGGG